MLLQKYIFFTTFPSVGEKRNLSTIAFSCCWNRCTRLLINGHSCKMSKYSS